MKSTSKRVGDDRVCCHDSHHELCFVIVSSYTHLQDLAHQPKGCAAEHSIRVYSFNMTTGGLTLIFVLNDPTIKNVAFLRKHPVRNVLYAVTESIEEEGRIIAFSICNITGVLRPLSDILTGGRSPCYITIAYDLQRLFVVNYWDSSIKIIDLDDEGRFLSSDQPVISVPGKNAGKVARKHGDDPHGVHRGMESHAHALELDPVFGRVAYVPDLGDDYLKQFVLSEGKLHFAGNIKFPTDDATVFCDNPPLYLGTPQRRMIGPRYMKFHQHFNIAYLVNELASSVSVFAFDEEKAQGLQPVTTSGATQSSLAQESTATQTLTCIQEISTIPHGYCKKLNTCARVTMDPSGKFVLVSNRGHDSIAVFPIVRDTDAGFVGMLGAPQWYHIGGHTPRHFKFAPCGKWIFVANQDSNHVAVFEFSPETGAMSYKHRYKVPSPNFAEAVCISQERRQDAWVYSRL